MALKQFSIKLNPPTLPEIEDFNGFRDAMCFWSNPKTL
jgi:hypothetical protein